LYYTHVATAIVTSDAHGSHVVLPGAITFGLNLDGVVSFESEFGTLGTGALISDRHILTAAHLIDQDLDGVIDPMSNVRQARFYLPSGNQFIDLVPAAASLPAQWPGNADLAIVTLAADAPAGVPRYPLYGLTNELGQQAVVTGHGALGSGPLGGTVGGDDQFLHAGLNRIEALGEDLDEVYDAEPGTMLVFDFDSGQPANNTLGLLDMPSDLGFGNDEVGMFLADSGGPLFIDGVIAGVNQAIFGGLEGDVTVNGSDGSWGELQYVTRVSSFRDFITTATGGQAVFVGLPTDGTWANDGNGDWSAASNWAGGVPNGAGGSAVFGAVITAARTVAVDAPVTVGRITLDNSNSYTLAGASTITLDASSGDAQIDVVSGSHVIGAPVSLADNTVFTIGQPTSSLSITGPLDASGKILVKAGAGRLTANNIRAASLTINGGTVAIAPAGTASGTSIVSALSIAGDAAPTARFDVSNNAAIIDYSGTSPVATVRPQILAGRGGTGLGGNWNGNGITSSAANAAEPESRSVGYAENSALPLGPYATFRGQPVDDTALLIAFTRTGDANLDGVVNDDDVTIIGATYAPGIAQPHWALGDFDYNGFVDDNDVTLLGAFYDPSATPLAVLAAGAASNLAAVPEPATLILAMIAATIFAASVGALCHPACFSHASHESRSDATT
jgi:hypothetical protein